jgi:hypothetical protein
MTGGLVMMIDRFCPFAAIAESQLPDLSGVENRHSFSRHFVG